MKKRRTDFKKKRVDNQLARKKRIKKRVVAKERRKSEKDTAVGKQ